MKHILVIEDDPAIREGLMLSLQEHQFNVTTASEGNNGYSLAAGNNYDLIILDLMLPGKSGLEICRELRAAKIFTPVIMLTGKKEESDKIAGLETGADDYMTKPFSTHELNARIKAVMRRYELNNPDQDTFDFGNIHVDLKMKRVFRDHCEIKFSMTEFNVLSYFIRHANEVVTRDMLLDEVWGYDSFPTTRTVDNYILAIRKKIENDYSTPEFILTVPKAGYRFSARLGEPV